MSKKHLCVVGAGLCGSLLTIRLAQRGYRVSLFEKRPDLRQVELDAGRSINLALSDRGWKALQLVGLEDRVREEVIPMLGRYIHPIEGKGWHSPYSGRESEYINSVSRPGLNKILLDEAETYPNVDIHFDHSCVGVDPKEGVATFRGPHRQEVYVHADVVFGTDGAGSAVRKSLFDIGPSLRFDYSQDWLDHGYKELTIPADKDGQWRLDKNSLHIWPRQEFMLIALPNLDGSFTVTLFMSFDGEQGFNQLDTDQKIEEFFKTQFPSAREHMPDFLKDFHDNPTSSLGTIRCFPWQTNNNVLLMGDAAHAIVPFYGQGMNCSLEDVLVLDEIIDELGDDYSAVLNKYQSERKKDTDAIANLALENYYEMRDHVDNAAFIKKRKLEMQLERDHPEYSSKYNLVTFNEDLPYSIAMRKGRAQDEFLLNLLENKDLEDLNIEEVLVQLNGLSY